MAAKPNPSRRFMLKKQENEIISGYFVMCVGNSSDMGRNQKEQREGDAFKSLIQLGQSLDLTNAGSTSHRDYLNGTDIEGSKPRHLYRYQTYNKNEELMTDSVLGRKRAI